MSYVSGAVIPVKTANKEKFRKAAEAIAAWFRENGATALMDAWGVDAPDGKVTDFKRSVNAGAPGLSMTHSCERQRARRGFTPSLATRSLSSGGHDRALSREKAPNYDAGS